MATGHHKQTPPFPVKNDSSLNPAAKWVELDRCALLLYYKCIFCMLLRSMILFFTLERNNKHAQGFKAV